VKLKPRYTVAEKAVLVLCIKPFEHWTADEHQMWVRSGTGFRHFLAANNTPIEHYRPMPAPTLMSPPMKPAA
jgi:hypothetical protein